MVHLMLPSAVPPSTLILHARLLDFKTGGFGRETSLLLKEGRILRIGGDAARGAPSDAQVINAGGRYAIPGLSIFMRTLAMPIRSHLSATESRRPGHRL